MRSGAVDNFLFDIPEPEKLIMEALRDIIFSSVKGVEEGIKWRIPVYSCKGLLCYINFDRKHKKVALGLIEGFLIEDKYRLFQSDTTNVKKILFSVDEDLPVRKIRYYLREAVKINQTKTKNFMGIHKPRTRPAGRRMR